MVNFDLNLHERLKLYQYAVEKIEGFYGNTKSYAVTPSLDVAEIKAFVDDLVEKVAPEVALDHVVEGLEKYAVHTPHPKYFGLYNPRTNFPSILADFLTAAFNPQIAAWSHSPFAAEVEAKLVSQFGRKFGYPADSTDGVFAAGGAEANLTAVLCALNHAYPSYGQSGLVGFRDRPMIYCSAEAHHSIQKAAKMVGLGYQSVKAIPTDSELKMDSTLLRSTLKEDLAVGKQPFLLVGTAGTTGTGTIDDLPSLSATAKEFGLWFHVDAAYGGAAVIHPELKAAMTGIEASDSITFDAHKWMSVPMATSLFLTSHKTILSKTFGIRTDYMPKDAAQLEIVDPFSHSIQWSRRFIGLKLYLSLLFFGWEGYEAVIGYQNEMGIRLREKLVQSGWTIKNKTPLPVICFTDDRFLEDPNFVKEIKEKLVAAGKSWISMYPVGSIPTFRACITNYNTTEVELDEFIAEMNEFRDGYGKN